MGDHPNAVLFKKGYGAFMAGDMDTVRSLFAPDILWHVSGNNHFAGDYQGVDSVLTLFGQYFQETGGTFKVDVHDILANDIHGVAIATLSAQKDGKSLSDRYVQLVQMKDGLQTESWIYADNPDVIDDFWG